MEAHAERVYPEECCGLLIGRLNAFDESETVKSVIDCVALDNEWTPEAVAELDAGSKTKRRRYWIDPKDMMLVQKQAREQGLNIVGVYHSHPDHVAVPSECDRAQAWPTYAYVIVSVCKGKAVDTQNWALDLSRQFQPEAMRVSPSSASSGVRDRMPVSA